MMDYNRFNYTARYYFVTEDDSISSVAGSRKSRILEQHFQADDDPDAKIIADNLLKYLCKHNLLARLESIISHKRIV